MMHSHTVHTWNQQIGASVFKHTCRSHDSHLCYIHPSGIWTILSFKPFVCLSEVTDITSSHGKTQHAKLAGSNMQEVKVPPIFMLLIIN